MLAKGDFSDAERHFSPVVRTALPTAALRQVWTWLTAQLGAFEQQAATIKALTPADRARRGNLLGAPAAYWLSLQGYHPERVARDSRSRC